VRDRREEIAVRIVELAGLVPGVTVLRNVQTVTTARVKPVVVIWDGDEQPAIDRALPGPQIIEMTPEIRILKQSSTGGVGSDLNALRLALLKTVYDDCASGQLKEIVGANGKVGYGGCAMSGERGERIEGELLVTLTFQYPLIASEL
jgi:hypothetical protein